jgi:sn-glycerol 3-phosphate transport system ATP-binding protein
LRPEHASLQSSGGDGWPLRVEMVEMLGAERLVYGRIGDELFTVRVDGTRVAPQAGDLLSLVMDARQLHWFDAGTSQRVQ